MITDQNRIPVMVVGGVVVFLFCILTTALLGGWPAAIARGRGQGSWEGIRVLGCGGFFFFLVGLVGALAGNSFGPVYSWGFGSALAFLGLIGWFVSFVWALAGERRAPIVLRRRKIR